MTQDANARTTFLARRHTPGSGGSVYAPPTVGKPRRAVPRLWVQRPPAAPNARVPARATQPPAPQLATQPSPLRRHLAIFQDDLAWNEAVAVRLPAAIAEARQTEGTTVTTQMRAGGVLFQTTWSAEQFALAPAVVADVITTLRAATWDMSNQINPALANPAPVTVEFQPGSIVLPPITVEAEVNMPARTPIEIKYDQQGKPIGVQPVAALPTRSVRPQGF